MPSTLGSKTLRVMFFHHFEQCLIPCMSYAKLFCSGSTCTSCLNLPVDKCRRNGGHQHVDYAFFHRGGDPSPAKVDCKGCGHWIVQELSLPLYTMSKSTPSKRSKDFAEQCDKFRSTLDSAFLVVVNEGALLTKRQDITSIWWRCWKTAFSKFSFALSSSSLSSSLLSWSLFSWLLSGPLTPLSSHHQRLRYCH